MSEKFSISNDCRQGNIPICHYLNLNYFLEQLFRGEFYVGRKDLFNDTTEARLPIELSFYPTQACCPLTNVDKLIREGHHQKIDSYKEHSKSFVSSWTFGDKDDYLMWNVYAKQYGVCIVSTVHDFIRSLDQDRLQNYNLKYNKVAYRRYSFSDPIDKLLFQKLPLYSSEKEFRFIFMPKDEEEKNKSHIWIPFEPKVMINEVVLSPFFSINTTKFLQEIFKEKYGLKVTTSKDGIFRSGTFKSNY